MTVANVVMGYCTRQDLIPSVHGAVGQLPPCPDAALTRLNSILATRCRLMAAPVFDHRYVRRTREMLFQLSLVTLVGVLVRFSGLAQHAIHLDEAISVEFVTRNSLPELAAFVRQWDVHPPLYYQTLLLWTRVLGTDLVDLRLLSALLGALTVPAVYVFTLLLTRRRTAFLAALLFALSPFQLQVAQDTRMYALLTFWAVLAGICLVSVLKQAELEDARPFWWGMVLLQGLALHTHSAGGLYLTVSFNAALLWLLWRRRSLTCTEFPGVGSRGLGFNWGVSQVMVFLLWLPGFGSFLTQARRVGEEFWIQPTGGWEIWSAISRMAFAYLPISQQALAAPVAILLLLAVLGVVRMRRWPVPLTLAAAMFLTPMAVALSVDWFRPLWHARSFNYICIPLYLLAAAGITGPLQSAHKEGSALGPGTGWQERLQPAVQVTLVIAMALLQIWGNIEYYAHGEREAWRDAAAAVAHQSEPGDAVVFQAGWVQLPFMYHYSRMRGHTLTEWPWPEAVFSGTVAEPRMTPENVLTALAPLVDGDRVWLVYSHDWYTDPDGLALAALDRQRPVLGEWSFRSIRVFLFGPA